MACSGSLAGPRESRTRESRLPAQGSASALAAPELPLRHAGRWITDAHGRVVIVHGINMVYKLPPYSPAAVGFGDDDAVFLARSGFNVVRVGVIWKAVEPRPAAYDDGYLSAISAHRAHPGASRHPLAA